ncbi:hypothetical protein M8J76_008739 [Diaphorina citri]|nr:hypothetical protein M8J76_008739 [Diaphorina citri]
MQGLVSEKSITSVQCVPLFFERQHYLQFLLTMSLKYSAAVFLICCSTSYGLISFGSCPTKNPVANFDLPRFSGFWLENRALEGVHLTQEAWGACLSVLFDYTTIQNVTVGESNIFNDFLPGGSSNPGNFTRETTILSTIVFGKNHTGAINADFVPNRAEFRIHGTWATWRFLKTSWILTRSSTLAANVSGAIINSLFAQGLPETQYQVTQQSNCEARRNRKPFFSPLAFAQVKNDREKFDEVVINPV